MQSEETVLASYGPTKTAILTVPRYARELERRRRLGAEATLKKCQFFEFLSRF